MKRWSSIDYMILAFTFVIATGLMLFSALVVIIEIKNPQADTDAAVDGLSRTIGIILGALMGLLAGKTEATRNREPPDDGADADG